MTLVVVRPFRVVSPFDSHAAARQNRGDWYSPGESAMIGMPLPVYEQRLLPDARDLLHDNRLVVFGAQRPRAVPRDADERDWEIIGELLCRPGVVKATP